MREIACRSATIQDLESINRIIGSAIEQWPLPDRVKRLILPSYRYQAHDLDHLEITLATAQGTSSPLAVAALEPATPSDLPEGRTGMILHGIYVDPAYQRHGIGRRLIEHLRQTLAERGLEGLLVKAQAQAAPFFTHLGMQALAVRDPLRDYPYRFWLATSVNGGHKKTGR